jgi:hypothetical protein
MTPTLTGSGGAAGSRNPLSCRTVLSFMEIYSTPDFLLPRRAPVGLRRPATVMGMFGNRPYMGIAIVYTR